MAIITGTKKSDVLVGTKSNDTITGDSGDDVIDGDKGNDFLDGGIGRDTLFGGAGNDTIVGGQGADLAYGGSGSDFIGLSDNSRNVGTGGGNGDVIFGDGFNTFALVSGNVVGQNITSTSQLGDDTIYGTVDLDTIYGDNGDNLDGSGTGGNDTILAGNSADTVYGEGGNDSILGEGGNDFISGGSGNDYLSGGDGNDVLIGGLGADTIDGGSGDDRIVYNAAAESTATGFDTITGFVSGANFSSGDKIDITALLGPGSDIHWNGLTPVANGAWYQPVTGGVKLMVDVTGDGVADLQVFIQGPAGLKHSDILGVINAAPVANGDANTGDAVTEAGTASAGDPNAAGNVLVNATDADGDGLAVTTTGTFTGAYGALVLSANGAWTYTLNNSDPDTNALAQGHSVTDSFTYTVTDGLASSSGNLVVTITGANDGPVVSTALTSDTNEGDVPYTLDLLSGASDPDDGETASLSVTGITYTVDGGAASATPPAGVSLNGSTLTVDPTVAAFNHLAVGEHTTIVVSYSVQDVHGASVAQTETITIYGTNDGPVAAADAGTTDEDTALVVTAANGVLANASDVDDGDILTVTAVNGVSSDVGHEITLDSGAKLTLNADGSYTYDPNGQFEALGTGQLATDTFSYTVTDNHGASSTATVTITINGVTDGVPLFTVNADNINFNDVVAGTYAAGTQYDALGGDDVVFLPTDATQAAEAGYNAANTFFGNAGNDSIVGGGMADLIDGGAGNDTLRGGARDDVLTGGAGNDVIDGGENPSGQFSDNDTANYLVAGVTTGVNVNLATHTATDGMSGTDTLVNIERVIGTQFADILTGGDPANASNNDSETFEGRGGNDTITGGVANNWAEYRDAAGAVWVDLRDGKAWDDGDGGVDTLVNINRVRGSAFDDQIYGTDSTNTERFEGMAGNDLIDGRGGPDAVHYTSSPGAVTVDLALGTASDGFGTTDTLVSIEGVRGSDFNDFLYGSNNAAGTAEFFEGMAGDDTIDGRGGFDRIEYNRSPSGVMVDLGNGIASDGFGGTDHFVHIEAARGSLFDDTLIGSSGNDNLDGNDGNDTLIGGLGNDILTGGNGDDTFVYTVGDGADSINGNLGNDTLTVLGTAGDDTVNIVMSGFPLAPPFGLGSLASVEFITLDLGLGNDTLSYAGSTGNVFATLGGTATAPVQNPMLVTGVENLIGGSGNDNLTGDQYNNVITGGPGNDVLIGGPGDDTFKYTIGDGADQIDLIDAQQGGYDTLQITGTGGNDTLDFVWQGGDMFQVFEGGFAKVDAVTLDLGGGLADTLNYAGTVFDITATLGGAASGFTGPILGVENIIGGNNNDTLNGDDNANQITGGAGNDTLSGGAGDDQFFYTIGDGADNVDGGAGNDTLVISGTNGNDTLDIVWSGTDISQIAGGAVTGIEYGWLDLGAGNDTVSYAGSTAGVSAYLGVNASGFPYTFTGVENITGGSGDDNLGGDDNANVLSGGSGNDGLMGAGGNDLLQGGDGNDNLFGEGGDDTLVGGAGNDYMVGDLTGETGNDTFVYVVGDGADSIDGGLGIDTLAINGTGFPNETLGIVVSGGIITQLAGGSVGNVEIVTLNFAGGEPGDTLSYVGTNEGISVDLQAGSATGFTSISGVENVTGGSGDDHLTGDGNANILIGHQGSDTLTGGAGADTFRWNAGDDSNVGNGPLDTVTDFDMTANSDKLDLRDLLVGEIADSNILDNYLDFHNSGGNTLIDVRPDGGAVHQQIVLQGIDLTAGGTTSDSTIIQNLLNAGKLIIDN